MTITRLTNTLVSISLLSCLPSFTMAQQGRTFVEARASTVEQSILNGKARQARDYGAGYLDWAKGQEHLASAERRRLENRQMALSYYYAAKRLNSEYRASLRPVRSSSEDLARWAKASAPQPLSPSELSANGIVCWPLALCEAPHARERQLLEIALGELARENDPARTMQLRRSIAADCARLKNDLRSRIEEFSAHDYVAARKFVDSLALEAAHWPRTDTDLRFAKQ